MGFMNSYKHLDHLCQGIYPDASSGISGYIEDMERHPRAAYQISGWKNDYDALKHYRWIRNQIAHEEYADEETLCEPGDIEWLDTFYQRIMQQTDPLARLHQLSVSRVQRTAPKKSCPVFSPVQNPVQPVNQANVPVRSPQTPVRKPKSHTGGKYVAGIVAAVLGFILIAVGMAVCLIKYAYLLP